MSENSKWKRHIPKEAPKTPIGVTPLTREEPPVSAQILESLELRYSVPLHKKTDKIEESDLEMWLLVCELKGWLTRDAADGMWTESAWGKLKKILDQAVAKGDQKPFEQFSKDWQIADIRKSAIQKIKPKDPKNRTNERLGIAPKIDALLPNIPANKPNSPISIVILGIIESLQRKLKTRAPTIEEIIAKSSKLNGMEEKGGIDKKEVIRQINKMGIRLSIK